MIEREGAAEVVAALRHRMKKSPRDQRQAAEQSPAPIGTSLQQTPFSCVPLVKIHKVNVVFFGNGPVPPTVSLWEMCAGSCLFANGTPGYLDGVAHWAGSASKNASKFQ